MKFNAAVRGEGNFVTRPIESFECPPGGKKQTHLFFRCWSIYLFSLVKKLYVGMFVFSVSFPVWGTVKCPGKSFPLLWWCVVEPLLLWQRLLVRGWLEKQCAWVWVGAISAITAPPVWGAPPSMAHLWGLVTITFPVITGTYTRLFTLISKHLSS